MDAGAARQAVNRFIDGAKLAADRLPAADREAAEGDTVVALLQRVLHPRLRAMLGESNLAVRQVREWEPGPEAEQSLRVSMLVSYFQYDAFYHVFTTSTSSGCHCHRTAFCV